MQLRGLLARRLPRVKLALPLFKRGLGGYGLVMNFYLILFIFL